MCIILSRFKVVADAGSNEPGVDAKILLEALILSDGQRMETLPLEKKNALRRGCAKTILLWEQKVKWFMPDLDLGMITTPGLEIQDLR